jgi:hypothetical protein
LLEVKARILLNIPAESADNSCEDELGALGVGFSWAKIRGESARNVATREKRTEYLPIEISRLKNIAGRNWLKVNHEHASPGGNEWQFGWIRQARNLNQACFYTGARHLPSSRLRCFNEVIETGVLRGIAGLRNTLEPDPDNTGVGSFRSRAAILPSIAAQAPLFQAKRSKGIPCLPLSSPVIVKISSASSLMPSQGPFCFPSASPPP